MKSEPGETMLRSIFRNSLVYLLLIFSFTPITQADDTASLNTNKHGQCTTLTVQWELANVSFYSVEVVDKNRGNTLFNTSVNPPTSSIQWVVAATPGAQLHLAIHTPPNLTSKHYKAAEFQVKSGPTTCLPSVTLVCCVAL